MTAVDIYSCGIRRLFSVGCVGVIAVVCILITAQIDAVQGQYGTVAGQWKVAYGDPAQTDLRLGSKSTQNVLLTIYDVDLTQNDLDFHFQVEIANTKLALSDKKISRSELLTKEDDGVVTAEWRGSVEIQGRYFGYTQLYVSLHPASAEVDIKEERSEQTLCVTVEREERVNDRIFTYTAAALMLLMFVNLGTALDLQRLKAILLRPVGPFVGFCCRYILMPALALGMGYLFFPQSKELQLALLYTALSPSGGLANICAVFLKGNINLSIATTTINSLLALAMLPLWIYALARVLYDDSGLQVPFVDMAVGSVALILALSFGLMLRLCIPKTTRFIFRFLKPLSVLLSLCLVGLTVGINAFAFKQLTVMIFLAALILPVFGYSLSFLFSKILCRSSTDALTIGIETSVLNMTFPIVLLQYSLEEPMADMVLVVPIMAALLSLCLVVVFYTVRRIFGWNSSSDRDSFDEKQLIEDDC